MVWVKALVEHRRGPDRTESRSGPRPKPPSPACGRPRTAPAWRPALWRAPARIAARTDCPWSAEKLAHSSTAADAAPRLPAGTAPGGPPAGPTGALAHPTPRKPRTDDS